MSFCKHFVYSLIISRAPEVCTDLKMDQQCHKNNRSLPQVANPWKDHEGATSNQNYWATKLLWSFKKSASISILYCGVLKAFYTLGVHRHGVLSKEHAILKTKMLSGQLRRIFFTSEHFHSIEILCWLYLLCNISTILNFSIKSLSAETILRNTRNPVLKISKSLFLSSAIKFLWFALHTLFY